MNDEAIHRLTVKILATLREEHETIEDGVMACISAGLTLISWGLGVDNGVEAKAARVFEVLYRAGRMRTIWPS
jgi:hypothetical protein